jgi:hypothetical protein
MKNTRAFGFVLLSAMCLTFSSCKKDVTQVVNQVFSATYSIQPNQWVAGTGNLSYYVNLSVPEIDNIIVQSGGVLVYLSFDNGSSFEAVPEDYGGIAYGAVHSVGSVTIDLNAIDGVSAVTPPTGTVLAKVVLLDGSPL